MKTIDVKGHKRFMTMILRYLNIPIIKVVDNGTKWMVKDGDLVRVIEFFNRYKK